MSPQYTLTIHEGANPSFSDFLKEQIRHFNNVHSPWHRASREEGARKALSIVVTGRDGEWLGGLSGEVYWDWLQVDDFWLRDDLRGQGIGTELLTQLEHLAAQRGAAKAFLTTFSFQARGFYERHGYAVVGTLPDYPPGQSLHTMMKRL